MAPKAFLTEAFMRFLPRLGKQICLYQNKELYTKYQSPKFQHQQLSLRHQQRPALTLYHTEADEGSGVFRGHLCSCTWTLRVCLETGHTQSFGRMQVWTPKPEVNRRGEYQTDHSLSEDGNKAHQKGTKCVGLGYFSLFKSELSSRGTTPVPREF